MSSPVPAMTCFLVIAALLSASCNGTARNGTARNGTARTGTARNGTASTEKNARTGDSTKQTLFVQTLVVSIPPQAYFARRIGGGRVRLVVLAGPGQNPHSYEPNPRQAAMLGEAGAWVLSGVEFEISLTPRIRRLWPSLKIVDGTQGVRFRLLEHHDGDHQPQHGDAGIDRHTWLGREGAMVMALRIYEALADIDSVYIQEYEKNYTELVRDIDAVFDTLKTDLSAMNGKSVLVYHPAFGYFLDEFGITQEAIETGGKEPTPRILNQLIASARQSGALAVFVQAQFPLRAAQTAADAIGAAVVPLDPLSEDWLENISAMGDALKRYGAYTKTGSHTNINIGEN